ncbi:MAG: hydroxyacylglutathione hydrolase [Pseudomonadota bacterium]|jgi:hydroxyacylglutathione hydrolase
MEIVGLRAFRDNYIWLLRRDTAAAVVDPGDAGPVLNYLSGNGLTLRAILVTHHHPDHVGGVAALAARHDLPVFGPAGEEIPTVTHPLHEGERVHLPALGASFRVLEVPGHTRGHIAYYGANALFCGDTLFGCGCGRLFEGTAQQMWNSLQKLAALPAHTRIYCAHEYTQANIAFALAVEPGNEALHERARQVAEMRGHDLPTVPFTLAEELATNPFLRVELPSVKAAAQARQGQPLEDPAAVFAAVREWKNRF